MDHISTDISSNIARLELRFGDSLDFNSRKFLIGSTQGVICYFSTLVSKQDIALSVLSPMLNLSDLGCEKVITMKHLEDRVFAAAEQIKVHDLDVMAEKILMGFCGVLLDGAPYGLCFGVQSFERRGLQEPENETMQRGAKDGFAEHYQTNISLIRRRMHNSKLKFEQLTVGSISGTPVILCYIADKAKKEDVDRVRAEIVSLKLGSVMESAYISGSIKKSGIFDAVGSTERPDTLCSKLSEGKLGIIVDGTPDVLIYPYLFIENFQYIDDYAARPYYSTFVRWVRYLAFIIAAFLPGTYAAVVIHRPELLPDILLTKFAAEQAGTPFTVLWELLLVNFLYEIMREAGLRAPKVLSQAVSIVGTLVIGDTAVSAGMIGAPSLMVIASSAIAAYAVPRIYDQLSVLRLLILVAGGLFGTWGVILSSFVLICNLTSGSSLGIPVTAPLAPFISKGLGDILARSSFGRRNKGES